MFKVLQVLVQHVTMYGVQCGWSINSLRLDWTVVVDLPPAVLVALTTT